MTCAVCNRSLTKDDAPAKTTYDHREYFFCGEVCEQKYETRLAKYARIARRVKPTDEFETTTARMLRPIAPAA
jgi:YHS domain-containing protein